jgi:peptide deformylase
MLRDIIQIGDPVLNKKTTDVSDVNDPKVKQLIEDLIDTCEENHSTTAGLSAPQINELLSVCVCRRTDIEELRGEDTLPLNELWEVMINPKVISKSEEKSQFWEACLSIGVGKNQLWGPVQRSKSIVVEYLDRNGNKKTLSPDGFFSHVVQHEIDHLNGILFLTYIDNPANIWKGKDLDSYLDETGEFPTAI